MRRWLVSACLLATAFTTFSQKADLQLTKGRELLQVEEFRAAYLLLIETQSSKKGNVRQQGKQALAELFLLQQLPDSAARFLYPASKQPASRFLVALDNFVRNKPDEAYTELAALANKADPKNSWLNGQVNHYAGLIQFRKRTAESIPLAITYLQRSAIEFKKDSIHAHLRLAQARLTLAEAYRANQEFDAAVAQSHLALTILERTPYAKPNYFAAAYGTEGRSYVSLEKYNDAKTTLEKSLQWQIRAGTDSASIGATYANLGVCFEAQSDLINCEKAYAQVATYWRNLKNQPERLVPFVNNRALFLESIDESTTALRSLEGVLPLVESGSVKTPFYIFQTYYNLAYLNFIIEEFDKTKTFIDRLDNFLVDNAESIPRSERLKFVQLKAKWCAKNDRMQEAVQLGRAEERDLDPESLYPEELGKFYMAVGDVYMSADSFALSGSYLGKAKKIFDADESLTKQIEVNNLLALNFLQLRQYDSAIWYSHQSLQHNSSKDAGLLYPFVDSHEAAQSCYTLIASHLNIFKKTGNQNALQNCTPYEQLGISLIRTIRKNLYSDDDRIRYNQRVTIFYSLLALVSFERWQVQQDSAMGKFFEYVEEGKFQALVNSISNNRVNSFKEINSALLDEERSLAKQKVLQNAQLVQLVTQRGDAGDLDQERSSSRLSLARLEMQHSKFLDSLRRNFSGYYELKYGSEPASLKELQRELATGELVLQIKVIDTVIFIQAITAKDASLFRFSRAGEWQRKIMKLRNLMQFSVSEDFLSLSNDIYNGLLKPVLSGMTKRGAKISSLTIVPSDFFYSLPMEALVVREEPLRYLIHDYDVVYAYSCNLLLQQKRKAETSNKNFLGVAPKFSDLDPGHRIENATTGSGYRDFRFQPLNENENEINQISSMIQGKAMASVVVSGPKASEKNLKKLDLSSYKYIHLATHGFVNSRDPARSGLALTNEESDEDNILYAAEIYGLTMNADLVCLSACETGLGQQASGEGLIGLGRSFFYSGARNLLLSLWKVPDESTSVFMVDFYKRLLNSQKLTGSLRQSKIQMMQDKKYQSPSYWAAFILIGGNE